MIILEAQDRASAQLRQVGTQVERLERQVQGAQRSSGGGLLGALTGGIGIGAGFQAAQQALQGMGGLFRFATDSVFALNAGLERTVATFTALTGSVGTAQEVVQALRREAAVTPFSDQEILAAGRALVSSAQGSTESLLELVRVAEQLAAIDPAQGLEGAALAVREAMAGDFESLIRRFEVSRTAIARFRAEGLSNLQAVQAALREMGVSAELVERLGRTFEGRITTIRSFGDEIRQRLGAGIFERVSDALGRLVRLIDQYGDRLRAWADEVGQALGGVLARLASRFAGPLLALLERLAPGIRGLFEGAFAQAPEQMERFAQGAERAAQASETLEHQLGRLGVEASTLQLQADRVRRSYDDQLEPLQRQLRLLQQSADLQRVQNALATNRATVEGIRLEREISALSRAARGQEDPNAPGLTLRQRMIALALQERRLQQEQLGLEEQRRPAIQTLEQQIAALQEQQRSALAPLEAQLANYRDQVATLQIQRQAQELLRQDIEKTAQAQKTAWESTNPPETLAAARQRGEDLAEAWLQGFEDYMNQYGVAVWGWVWVTFRKWYDGGGKQQLQALATEVGTDIGTAIADALGSTIGTRLDALRERLGQITDNPLVRAIMGGALGPAGPALVGARALREGIAREGITFEPGSITLGGEADPGFGERLKAALTQFLANFLMAEAVTDPGASARVQGAGR